MKRAARAAEKTTQEGSLLNTRHASSFIAGLAILALGACQPASTGGTRGGAQRQDEVAAIQRDIVPTQHLFADADVQLLKQAIVGYMKAVFPIQTVKPGFLETETLEWTEWRLPHRTRISVELENERARPNNVVMHVAALKIEPLIDEQALRSGRPVSWTWRLEGSRPEIEEIVVGQIVRRYLLLRQGKNPDDIPLEGPIPGVSPPQEGYFRPGTSSDNPKK